MQRKKLEPFIIKQYIASGPEVLALNHCHRSAFTLAEVLIALALLGVIAAFVIPKVLQSQIDQTKKATFREIIAMISEIQYQGRLSGDLKPTNFDTYFFDRINALSTCQFSQAPGCWGSFLTPETCPELNCGENVSGGFTLSNGAIVRGFEPCCDATSFGGGLIQQGWVNCLFVDWNGVKPPNTRGDDQMRMCLCFSKEDESVLF